MHTASFRMHMKPTVCVPLQAVDKAAAEVRRLHKEIARKIRDGSACTTPGAQSTAAATQTAVARKRKRNTPAAPTAALVASMKSLQVQIALSEQITSCNCVFVQALAAGVSLDHDFCVKLSLNTLQFISKLEETSFFHAFIFYFRLGSPEPGGHISFQLRCV